MVQITNYYFDLAGQRFWDVSTELCMLRLLLLVAELNIHLTSEELLFKIKEQKTLLNIKG